MKTREFTREAWRAELLAELTEKILDYPDEAIAYRQRFAADRWQADGGALARWPR